MTITASTPPTDMLDVTAAAPAEAGADAEETSFTAAWTADGSATVELARLAGPAHGRVRPPRRLYSDGPVDLDQPALRLRLYQACLLEGGPFDIYQWVNLDQLARVWPQLELPEGVAASWSRALQDAGLIDAD